MYRCRPVGLGRVCVPWNGGFCLVPSFPRASAGRDGRLGVRPGTRPEVCTGNFLARGATLLGGRGGRCLCVFLHCLDSGELSSRAGGPVLDEMSTQSRWRIRCQGAACGENLRRNPLAGGAKGKPKLSRRACHIGRAVLAAMLSL